MTAIRLSEPDRISTGSIPSARSNLYDGSALGLQIAGTTESAMAQGLGGYALVGPATCSSGSATAAWAK
jgi:hypothetical protein